MISRYNQHSPFSTAAAVLVFVRKKIELVSGARESAAKRAIKLRLAYRSIRNAGVVGKRLTYETAAI